MSTLSLRKIKHDSSAVDNIILDSNGQVGINATPSAPLTIGRVSSVNEGGQIDLCRSTDNASAWGIDVYGSTSTPSLRIIDNVAAAVRMQIDGNGRVTTPYQPSFSAYTNSGDTVADGNAIPYGGVVFNIGNCYNGSTYRFTAPVSGVYFFIWCNKGTNGQTYYTRLAVNGSAAGSASEHYANIANPHMHSSAMVQMSAGDFAWVRSGSNYTRSDSVDYFSGYLVG